MIRVTFLVKKYMVLLLLLTIICREKLFFHLMTLDYLIFYKLQTLMEAKIFIK